MNKLAPFTIALASLAACVPPPKGAGGGGSTTRQVQPDKCGNISTTDVGRKTYSFLQASAELDRASLELETSVVNACRTMAGLLEVSPLGDTKTVCKRAIAELNANLQVSTKTEKHLVTRYTPPVCTSKLDLAASFTAQCEAKVAADVRVSCDGSCSGTCNGACAGTCSSGTSQACNGTCAGTCSGTCSGSCNGYANIDASAECKASAEVRANVTTTCTEPKVEVVAQEVTIVDDTKFKKAQAAINAGMPAILAAGKRAELVGRAGIAWAKSLGRLINSAGDLVYDLGASTVCVAGELGAALAASAQIEARFSVSIEVSAELSASAGAQSY